ncbi:tRNA (adenosine(37)-N6)-dimethylallyltransferase MiaA [Ahrensia kielensis]|uniref:tRNA dimethylallyltransferase n=1 Tax=Ahrensia kielensis TaxID=76980 RepID=A0ABU9T5L4_9HYPH
MSTNSTENSNFPWRNATLLAGPTASGKSSLALDIARKNDGIIINTDSMQVYDVLRVLTARPSIEDEKSLPHHLYGHVHPASPYSTGNWLRDVEALLSTLSPEQHVIFVGGTGLYFRALLGGLSPMPMVNDEVRLHWRERLIHEGAAVLHRELEKQDADVAKTLNPSDGQRIARALEVIDATGKSILWWQNQKGQSLVAAESVDRIVIEPDREILKTRIAKRFDQMVDEGALGEVEAINALEISSAMPAMKAIGVKQLSDYLAGTQTLDTAIELSKIATRQYAKRQMTWFRNQLGDNWRRVQL